jgi:hypothetical protein
MCEYIKDDGEQCGMDNHDGAFCHMHEDTEQAEEWRDKKRADYGAVSGAQSGSSGIEMDTTCDDCETALRRTERLTDHENLGGKMLFVALVECDCDEHVLGTQPVRVNDLPGGWL